MRINIYAEVLDGESLHLGFAPLDVLKQQPGTEGLKHFDIVVGRAIGEAITQ
jgi:hypothetical protein